MNGKNMSRRLAVAAIGVLVSQLALADTVYTYDFNHLTGDDAYLNGQDGWVGSQTTASSMRARGPTGGNVYAATMGTGTGAGTATAYRDSSGDADWPFDDSVKIFTLAWYSWTANWRISQLGLGNASGATFLEIGGSSGSWRFTSAANTSTTGGSIGGNAYYNCLLEVDLVAKTASFSVNSSPIAGMQDMALELPVGFVASDIKSLFLRSRDQGLIDDIVLTVPPQLNATKISILSGDEQSGPAGYALASPLQALVQDDSDNPVLGVPVTFAVASGGGSFASEETVLSDAAGIATSPVWTLGASAGANSATATSEGLTGSPLTFTATATPPPTQVSIHGGNNQTADAGDPLPNPLQVLVQDAADDPVAGVPVTFAVATGGGSFAGGSPVLSDSNGIATSTAWTLGQTEGAQTATATSEGLSGSPLTFTATATVPPQFTYDFDRLTGGDAYLAGQDGWVGSQTVSSSIRARGTTDIRAATMGTGTGAGTATAYRDCTGDAAWPFDNSVKAFTMEWYSIAGSSRISQVGLGDVGGTTFLEIGGSLTSWRFTSADGNSTTAGSIPGGYNNYDCLLEVDLVAGTASFSIDQNSSGTWTPVAGMQDMDLELPPGFVASDVKTLFLRSRDQGSIDDIVITNIPVPPAGTVILLR